MIEEIGAERTESNIVQREKNETTLNVMQERVCGDRGEYSHLAPIYVPIASGAGAHFLEDKFRTYAGSSSEERKRRDRGRRERYFPASGYPKE